LTGQALPNTDHGVTGLLWISGGKKAAARQQGKHLQGVCLVKDSYHCRNGGKNPV